MTDSGVVLLASNRGPVSFHRSEDGALTAQRGGGGLVSGLSGVGAGTAVLWVCAALSDRDRHAALSAPEGRLHEDGYDTGGIPVRMLVIDPVTFHRAYNAVANSTLWFVHHLLYNTPAAPVFDSAFRRDWSAYRAYNASFADALAADAPAAARVLVQDYHLSLVPALLRARRPDLRVAHFSHTPWAPAAYYRLLPDDVAREVLEGILGADQAGFLSARWADAFAECCARVLGADVDGTTRVVTHAGRSTRLGVHALGVDGEGLRARASQPDVEDRLEGLRQAVGDRRALVRVDRTELSKNIVRGLAAYRELLRRHPEWRERVVHVAFAYPSRHDLPEYREYTASVQRIAREIDDEFGTSDWRPVVLRVDDDFARSLAAYRLADVLVVNPLRDGMNLVAKEGPVLAERGCALLLSREAGAADDLGADALLVNPFDVTSTAEAMHQALLMPDEDRLATARRLAAAATACPPARWFADQLRVLDGPRA